MSIQFSGCRKCELMAEIIDLRPHYHRLIMNYMVCCNQLMAMFEKGHSPNECHIGDINFSFKTCSQMVQN